jgi:hypothetical protein
MKNHNLYLFHTYRKVTNILTYLISEYKVFRTSNIRFRDKKNYMFIFINLN